MTESDYDNLEVLYAGLSKAAIDGIFTGESYTVDGVEFVSKYAPGSTAERFHIVKSLPFVEYFVEFARQFESRSILELGIAEGGSTALLALVTKPRKLVAIDLESVRVDALDEFAVRRGLTDTVKAYYAVDQSDASTLRSIVAEEFGEGIDWVLDDASHKLEPTRTSFETLFPYLKPGGVYTIEDWKSDIVFRDAVLAGLRNPSTPEMEEVARQFGEAIAAKKSAPDAPLEPSLSQLPVELFLACASSNEVVASVAVNKWWIMVRRGSAPLDPERFQISDLYEDYYRFLPPRG
jgi:predicted O-methyltransferase YrrM